MQKSFVVCAVLGFLACSCGSSATAPGVDEDTGAGTETGTGSETSTGGDSATTPNDGSMGVDTGPAADRGSSSSDTATSPSDSAGGCPATLSGTQAVRVSMNVTWPGTTGTAAGSGVAQVWTRSVFTIDAANKITATNSPCGSKVPDIVKNPIAGGGKTLVEFPATVWTAASMPTFTVTGTQTGFAVGSTVSMNATPVLVGLTMANPSGPWPARVDIQGVDHDGDGKLGITGVPRDGGGYTLPPTSILQTSHADRLYIASRNTLALSGKRETCTSTKGTVNVTHFDNHVIGCHVKGGGECTEAQYKFIDDNRTVFVVSSATYETVVVPDGSTCDAVRAALP